MVFKVFALYDSAIEAYNTPMFLRSRGEAIRSLQAAVNEPGNNIGRWADQYTLFEIGTYDDSTGLIELYEAKQSLGTALQYKDQPQNSVVELTKKEGA